MRKLTLPTGQTATLLTLNYTDAHGRHAVEETAVVATGTHTELLVISTPTQAIYTDAAVHASIKQAVKTLA